MAERKKTSPPMTEEQLRQVTVGGLKPIESSITLVEYDRAWPEKFAREAQRIKATLSERAIRVEHAGSTSVPGLWPSRLSTSSSSWLTARHSRR